MKGDKSIVSLRGEMSHLGLCCSDIGENWISILLIYGSNSHGILTDIYALESDTPGPHPLIKNTSIFEDISPMLICILAFCLFEFKLSKLCI